MFIMKEEYCSVHLMDWSYYCICCRRQGRREVPHQSGSGNHAVFTGFTSVIHPYCWNFDRNLVNFHGGMLDPWTCSCY